MTTALAVSRPAGEIQEYLRQSIGDLATACSGHFTPERMIQVATICVYKTPKIAECDRASILASVIQAASLGLDLSPNRGEGYLIPRWNKNTKTLECQFQPGFKGLAKLAMEADPDIVFIQPRLVRHKDQFAYGYDPDLWVKHTPCIAANGGPVTHVYSIAKFRSGDRLIEVMTRDEVEDIRQRSERPNSGPWAEQWGEMARKTVLKRHTKSLKQSPKLAAAIEADDREYVEAESRPALQRPDNQSGHATGIYASPEQSEAWKARVEAYVAMRNKCWLDKCQDEITGEFPQGCADLCTPHQADNYLLEWAISTGRLSRVGVDERGQKAAQFYRLTAIVAYRSKADEKAITRELADFLDREERRQTELIRYGNPELFGDMDEAQAMDDDPETETTQEAQ